MGAQHASSEGICLGICEEAHIQKKLETIIQDKSDSFSKSSCDTGEGSSHEDTKGAALDEPKIECQTADAALSKQRKKRRRKHKKNAKETREGIKYIQKVRELKLLKPCRLQSLEHRFLRQLNSEIKGEVIISSGYINALTSCCQRIKASIQELAQEFFADRTNERIIAAAYGSMETCLALPGSDLDIAICGVSISSKEELSSLVDLLSEKVAKLPFVTKSQAITSASVPVINLVRLKDNFLRL